MPILYVNVALLFVSSDQTSLLEFLHILTTNHKLVFAPVNNEPDFIAGLCHWLLVMGTHKSLAVVDNSKAKENRKSEGELKLLCSTVMCYCLLCFTRCFYTVQGGSNF